MIIVTASTDESGQIYALLAEGHANYAEHGKDIVCSAVTAIMATAIVSLQDLLELEPRYDLSEGRIYIDLEDMNYEGADVQLLMESSYLGLRQLAEQEEYSDYIRISDD